MKIEVNKNLALSHKKVNFKKKQQKKEKREKYKAKMIKNIKSK